jgi:hypothetical protein
MTEPMKLCRQCNNSHLNTKDPIVRAAIAEKLPKLVQPHLICAAYNDPRTYHGICAGALTFGTLDLHDYDRSIFSYKCSNS